MSQKDRSTPTILIEAEDFRDHGGWTLESQFSHEMGSPYLLAHGLGRPVTDASTTVEVEVAGDYDVWVRCSDWVPSHHPGRFQLVLESADSRLEKELGNHGSGWSWQPAGSLAVAAGPLVLTLHDLTGFEGRCDAVLLTPAGAPAPDEPLRGDAAWRRRLRGLPPEPVDAGTFDVVVVGGGVSGCAAALAAARLGQTVALLSDRPVLGGNASNEIGLMPRGTQGALLRELSVRDASGNLAAQSLLEAEPTATVFLEHRVFASQREGARIVSVDAVAARGGQELRLRGSMFIDASGIAILGVLSGAATLFGREAKDEFGESYGPDEADDMHHGNTLFFRTRMADEPVPFPEVPWATEVSKDYANLSGQLIRPGLDNGPGPSAGANPSTPEFRFGSGADVFPATHFWEYGQWLDPYTTGEHIRDHLMRALYGTFANVKALEPERYANLELEWIAHVSAKGEFRRYRGDHVLSEVDIREHVHFDDALIENNGAFCIHCAFEEGESPYDFRLKDWIWDERDKKPYAVPFRCLYSADVENLLAAGKHISVTHLAGSSVKFMGNGAQHGVATAAGAALCNDLGETPRGLVERHLDRLKALVGELTDCDHDHHSLPPEWQEEAGEA